MLRSGRKPSTRPLFSPFHTISPKAIYIQPAHSLSIPLTLMVLLIPLGRSCRESGTAFLVAIIMEFVWLSLTLLSLCLLALLLFLLFMFLCLQLGVFVHRIEVTLPWIENRAIRRLVDPVKACREPVLLEEGI